MILCYVERCLGSVFVKWTGRHVWPGLDFLIPPPCVDVTRNKNERRPVLIRPSQVSLSSQNKIILRQMQTIAILGAGQFCVWLSFFFWDACKVMGRNQEGNWKGQTDKNKESFSVKLYPRRNSNVSLFYKNYAVCITSMTLGNRLVYHANVILYKYPAVSAPNPKFLQLLEYWFINGGKLLYVAGFCCNWFIVNRETMWWSNYLRFQISVVKQSLKHIKMLYLSLQTKVSVKVAIKWS